MSEQETIFNNASRVICEAIRAGRSWDEVAEEEAVIAAVKAGYDIELVKDAWM
ncbi:hypothetical protein ID007_004332 [Salmonella enterica]|nr:hypothetical protein [Salmonella enterica]